MAETVFVNAGVYFDKYDLGCSNSVAFSASAETEEKLCAKEKTVIEVGLLPRVSLGVAGYWDDSFADIHNLVNDGVIRPITVLPKLSGAVGDYCSIGAGFTRTFDQFNAAVPSLAKFSLGLGIGETGSLARGRILQNGSVSGSFTGSLVGMELTTTALVLICVHAVSVSSQINWSVTDGTTTHLSGTFSAPGAKYGVVSLGAGKSLRYQQTAGSGTVIAAAGRTLNG